MIKPTKAELSKQIEELNNRLASVLQENDDLKIENSRLNGELGRQIGEKIDLRAEIDKLNKQIELDNAFYKDNDTMKKKLDETLILSARKTGVISKLEKQIEDLKRNNTSTVQKIKNERGAGRKERFSDKQKEEIKDYRSQGKSIREIAQIYKCSTGLIHKLINE